jgi:CRP-like cAMP-binding protein
VDFEFEDEIKDRLRKAIYYAFARHGIEIPWPLHVEYERPYPEPDAAAEAAEREAVVGGMDLFAGLDDDSRRGVAAGARFRTFGSGEAIVREGDAGQSLFVVCSGAVAVVTGSQRQEVAKIDAGGYFGEMSLLTGEPRNATVVARGDARVLEVGAAAFRQVASASPDAMERVAAVAAARRVGLEAVKSELMSAAGPPAQATLLARMRRFLRLGQR